MEPQEITFCRPDHQTGFWQWQLTKALREQWFLVIMIVSVLTSQALITIVSPWPLKIIFDSLVPDVPLSKFAKRLIPAAWAVDKTTLLTTVIIALALMALLEGVFLLVQNYAVTTLYQRVTLKLRLRLFSHLLELPMIFYQKIKPGEIISRLSTDTVNIQHLVEATIILAARSAPTILGISIVMFWVDWRFALVALSVMPVLTLLTHLFSNRIRQASRRQRQKESDITNIAESAVHTYKCVSLLGLQEKEVKRLAMEGSESMAAAVSAGAWQGWYASTANVLLALGTAILILIGVYRIWSGAISLGELVVFMIYLRALYKPLREFTKFFSKLAKSLACNDRIEEIMALEPCLLGVWDLDKAEELRTFREKLCFKTVWFAYEEDRWVLEDISFMAAKGEKVAIVGESGSGKSALVNLIPRFFDPQRGCILVDGWPIRMYTLRSLRDLIAIVPQKSILFGASAAVNIGIGRLTASMDEIIYAAKLANAHDFIMKLPRGYETQLGTGEALLSGGEERRIVIARAILRDAPIVILDEPMTGLDAKSKHLVMEAFDRLIAGRTTFIVSHQLFAVHDADLILVLKEGKLVEKGDHAKLMGLQGVYWDLWQSQFPEEKNGKALEGKTQLAYAFDWRP
ncbi:MAG: ABC transporter ATP-binding protein [Deltaproteobacteria bacterium]